MKQPRDGSDSALSSSSAPLKGLPDFAAWLLWVLLLVAIGRLWLVQLPSSFWVDELVTAFVVNHPHDPSFADAPQVPQSIYYALPSLAQRVAGFSEVVYRIPSILTMALALFLIARIAARLIHPKATWFAIFACMALRGINYHAGDARPYALGIAVAAGTLLFLIRWMDSAHWTDAFAFVVCAALVWRIQLIYWPFYLVIGAYAAARFLSRTTPVKLRQAALIFGLTGLALAPVAWNALQLVRSAQNHAFADQPRLRALLHEIRWNLVLIGGALTWATGRLLRWKPEAPRVTVASGVLIATWWLGQPVVLYAYSHLTGHSVFVERYTSIALPGLALAATALIAPFIPAPRWKIAALALGAGLLLSTRGGTPPWPRHDNSDWRGAAQEVSRLASPDMPVLCPSPFIEARTPAWRPDYPLPGFLYAHLPFYSLKGTLYLLPFEKKDGHEYAASLASGVLVRSGRFLIYGGDNVVKFWSVWFAARPELDGWSYRIERFGDVNVSYFFKNQNLASR